MVSKTGAYLFFPGTIDLSFGHEHSVLAVVTGPRMLGIVHVMQQGWGEE